MVRAATDSRAQITQSKEIEIGGTLDAAGSRRVERLGNRRHAPP
jgi:hypothetical protein